MLFLKDRDGVSSFLQLLKLSKLLTIEQMSKLFLKTSLPPFAHLCFLSEVQSGNFHYFCFLFIIFSENKSMGRILKRFSSFPFVPAALALCSHLSGLLTSLTPAGKACGILLEVWLLCCLTVLSGVLARCPGLLLSLPPVNPPSERLCSQVCWPHRSHKWPMLQSPGGFTLQSNASVAVPSKVQPCV